MRRIVSLLSIALLASAGSAFAQSNCPTDTGAALAAACPCAADSGGHAWKNHGQYVKCVVQFRNGLRRQGCLDAAAQRTIARCAARSTCGKVGAILCCFYDTSGTCNAGVCSNDATHTCASNADCITATGPKLSRHAETCTAQGGTNVGGGSVCSACPIPPPTP